MNKNNTINDVSKPLKTVLLKNSLKLLSWNIQAPSTAEGDKFKIHDFKSKLIEHDFICLQEIRKNVNITGYRSKCNTRTDSNSGGVGIFVKNKYIKGVEFIKDKLCSEYIICRVKKEFFGQSRDIFLVNAYITPENSINSSNSTMGKEVLFKLEEVINDLKEKGDVILCGDFNSRIGNKPGILTNDSSKIIPVPEDYESDKFIPRNSQDDKTNPYGTQFIKMVLNNQLIILNGRTLGDFQGKFTSIQKQGCSVVDYIAVTRHLKQKVSYFKVNSLTMYSDHKPLTMEMRCDRIDATPEQSLKANYQPAPTRFLFNEENKSNFIENLTNENSMQILNSLHENIHAVVNNSDKCNSFMY